MSNAIRHLMNNLGAAILALLLAFAVWIAATLQVDPFTTQEFLNVPIETVNQPEGTVFLEEISDRVSVKARAPESVLAELRVSDFTATMDLATLEPGMPASVPISVTCSNEVVRIESREPEQQRVHLEMVRTITRTVAIQVKGEAATGYGTARPVVLPSEVTIEGPDPYLGEVVSVTGSIDIEGAKESVVQKISVMPLDSDGRLVSGLQWSPDKVEVRIGVSQRVGYKPDVEVVPDLRGEPAPGYRRGSVSVQPSLVTLKGPPSVLRNMPGFIVTLPISITDAVQNLAQRTPLTVPTGVVVVGVNYVTITVEILPVISSLTLTSTVEIQGLRSGWTATPSPPMVEVNLEGPESLVDALTSEDIQVLLNLADYTLGTHRVAPDVLAPADITVVNVIPETIEVVIALPPTEPISPTVPFEPPTP
jgi:YbbR domain-containing protein